MSFYNSGDMASAKELFKIVKNRYGGTMPGVFSRYYLGKVAMAEGENQEAMTHFQDYLEKSESYPFYRDSAGEAMAICMINDRQFDRAAEIYLDLSDNKDEDKREKYLEKAAEAYRSGNRNQEAVKLYRELLEFKEGAAKRKIEIKISILTG
jgi:tetratricopeptide (TPR) repeat protein